MRLLLYFILNIVILHSCVSQDNRQFKTFNYNNTTKTYGVQLPNNFDPNKTYPVLIGPSELNGKDSQSFYWKGEQETHGWILIDYPIYNATSRLGEIKALLNHLRSTYSVENNKFHVVCFSANSASIFDLVMAIPNEFQGITGMAGNPGTSSRIMLEKLKTVNVQFIVGDQDAYWMNSAKRIHKELVEIGVHSQIEIIKNGPHVMMDLVGCGFLERAHRLRK